MKSLPITTTTKIFLQNKASQFYAEIIKDYITLHNMIYNLKKLRT